jgi:hypothetical protein
VPKLLLVLAIAAVFYILFKRVRTLPPHKRRAETLRISIGAAVVAVIMLTLAGKMHWVGAALTGLLVVMRQALPLLLRAFPLLAQWRARHSNANEARHSTVSTRLLTMFLDHDSGQLSGEVREGPFAQWRLDDMNRDQLVTLRDYCEREDPESLQLLDSYMEQRFPGAAGESAGRKPPPQSDAMTPREALQILGVAEGASREDIVAAHRRLMQKLHPDRGGNDYLAAKINEAKDFLLAQE